MSALHRRTTARTATPPKNRALAASAAVGAALLLALAAPAHADGPRDDGPRYDAPSRGAPEVYLSVGAADASASLELDSGCRWCDAWSDTGSSGSGYTLGVGVRLNRWFAIEGSFLDSQDVEWSQNGIPVPGLPALYDTDVALDLRATSLTAVGRLPLGAFDLYGRIGAARVEGKSTQRATSVFDRRVLERSTESTRTGFTAGVGAGISVGEHVRLALDASVLPLDRDLLAERDGDAALVVVGVSFAVRFGL